MFQASPVTEIFFLILFNSFFYPNNLHSLISTHVSEDAP